MNQDYETTKNTGGQMTPAPVKQPAPAAPTDAEQPDKTSELQQTSENRQRALGEAERKAAADKAGKIATIMETVKWLGPRGLVNALGVWQHLSFNSKTPRPSSQDEFRALLFEMIHTGRLQMTGGNHESPLTKIFVRPIETRID